MFFPGNMPAIFTFSTFFFPYYSIEIYHSNPTSSQRDLGTASSPSGSSDRRGWLRTDPGGLGTLWAHYVGSFPIRVARPWNQCWPSLDAPFGNAFWLKRLNFIIFNHSCQFESINWILPVCLYLQRDYLWHEGWNTEKFHGFPLISFCPQAILCCYFCFKFI